MFTTPAPLAETAVEIEKRFGEVILSKTEFRGEITFKVPLASIFAVCSACKDDFAFDMLIDISSVDNMGEDPRFELVYELYSLTKNFHLRLKTTVAEDALEAPSIVRIWATANWHEREIYDMMGIKFTDHPDLRRILMWDGYPYFPLRKDFPLEGKPSDVPDVAFTDIAPLEGGPFVTIPTDETTQEREPRARHVE